MKDLLKRIIDTCNYNNMVIDTDETIEFLCSVVEPLSLKAVYEINELIVFPLMEQYSQTDDDDEKDYIKDTLNMVSKYISE